MKKVILLNLFCLLSLLVYAQKSKFEWGITSGVNMSKIQNYEWQRTDVPLEKPTWLAGSQLELMFRYQLSAHWAVGLNVQAIQKGWKGQTDAASAIDFVGMTSQEIQKYLMLYYERLYAAQKNRLGYYSIPINLEYRFWEQRLYAQMGGYWGILVDSPWYEAQKTSDWGASVGIGIRQPMTKRWLFNFNVAYQHGFSNIYNTVGVFNRLPELAKGNRTVTANLGLVLKF